MSQTNTETKREPTIYCQIMPAAPMWRAVYVEECEENESSPLLWHPCFRLYELTLVGWGLVAESDIVHALIWSETFGVLQVEHELIEDFVGLRTPRVLIGDFVRENRRDIDRIIGKIMDR